MDRGGADGFSGTVRLGHEGDGGGGVWVSRADENGGGVPEAGAFGGAGAGDFAVGGGGEGAFYGGVGGERGGGAAVLSGPAGAGRGELKDGKSEGVTGGLGEAARRGLRGGE